MKKNSIKKRGRVIETLPSLNFKVELEDGSQVLAYLAGRLRRFRIKILLGDEVDIEMSPYDQTRGRIVWRHKNQGPSSREEELNQNESNTSN